MELAASGKPMNFGDEVCAVLSDVVEASEELIA